MQPLYDWLYTHQHVVRAMVVVSAISAVATLVALPIVVARIRPDYFVSEQRSPDAWSERHPLIRGGAKLAKNLIGGALLLSGIWMLVLPGQGILTILVGLTLLDFPGKRRAELAVVRRPGVLRALNWIRHRSGREPLRVDGD